MLGISLRVPAAISLTVPAAISLCVPMGDHIDRPVTSRRRIAAVFQLSRPFAPWGSLVPRSIASSTRSLSRGVRKRSRRRWA